MEIQRLKPTNIAHFPNDFKEPAMLQFGDEIVPLNFHSFLMIGRNKLQVVDCKLYKLRQLRGVGFVELIPLLTLGEFGV